MTEERIPLNEKRLLTVAEFQQYSNIGRNNAFKIIRTAGCEIRIGKKVLVDRVLFDEWCTANAF